MKVPGASIAAPGTGAIIAAAGRSRRMGRPKALLRTARGHKSLVRHLVDEFVAAGIEGVVVVLGPKGEEVLAADSLAPASIAFNRDPKTEMIDSLRLGERYLLPGSTHALITPVDAPFTTSALVRALVAASQHEPAAAIVPSAAGRRGHPVLIPRSALRDPAASRGGVRSLLNGSILPVVELSWADERISVDLNTPADVTRHLGNDEPGAGQS